MKLVGLLLGAASVLLASSVAGSRGVPAMEQASPQATVAGLLAADRAFSAASARTDVVNGLSAMFDEKVVMGLPTGSFARTKTEAIVALRGNPANLVSRAEWTPVRGGISADGQQGFTFGYMTISEEGKPARLAKYLSYWVKRSEGWRVAAYKRAPRPEGEVSLTMMQPRLPGRLVRPTTNQATLARHRTSLDRAERSFSDEAQTIGIGPAFVKYGSPDAMNMFGEPNFLIGNRNIGQRIGTGTGSTSPVHWAPDDVIVASSGDLGITWGMIRTNGPPADGRPEAIPYSTVWHRATPRSPWRYIAE